jgi:hypothetical protein
MVPRRARIDCGHDHALGAYMMCEWNSGAKIASGIRGQR